MSTRQVSVAALIVFHDRGARKCAIPEIQTRVDQAPEKAGIHPLSPGCARLCSASGDPRRAELDRARRQIVLRSFSGMALAIGLKSPNRSDLPSARLPIGFGRSEPMTGTGLECEIREKFPVAT
jgi:hypothetical protein